MDLTDIICQAKACAAIMGAEYAHSLKYGESTEGHRWHLRQAMFSIKTLERNGAKVKHFKKFLPVKSVNTSALEKQKSFLSLRHTGTIVCIKTEISPCLSVSEISHIVEQLKLLCSTYNCKCN